MISNEEWGVSREILDWRTIQNHKKDVIYFGLNESKEHFLRKAEMCYDLRKAGKHFITEAIFKDGKGRADIYCVTDNEAIEIVHTEDIKKSGKNKYPCFVSFEYVKQGHPLVEKDILT